MVGMVTGCPVSKLTPPVNQFSTFASFLFFSFNIKYNVEKNLMCYFFRHFPNFFTIVFIQTIIMRCFKVAN